MSPPVGVVDETIHQGFITTRITSEMPARVRTTGQGFPGRYDRGAVTRDAVGRSPEPA